MVAPLIGKVSHLVGNNPSKWRKGIGTYQEVVYREIYPFIDLRVFGKDGRIEFDFIVRPGGDIARIRFAREGKIDASRILDTGDIEIRTSNGSLVLKKPVIYQIIDNQRVEIKGGFLEDREGQYAFQVAGYQKDHDLIIDPAVDLRYSTYLGGTNQDYGNRVALDSSGNIYITGPTLSTDFPVGQPHTGSYQGGYDIFVSKLSPDGKTLIYSTYIGGQQTFCGAADDIPTGIAVNTLGEAVVAGSTASLDFPIVGGPYGYRETECTTGYRTDAFVLKLSGDGQSILYSAAIGSAGTDGIRTGDDRAGDVALDNDGFVYITGTTSNSTGDWSGVPFPEKNAYQPCSLKESNIFIAKFDTSQTGDASLIFSTCFGDWASYRGGRCDRRGRLPQHLYRR